MSGNRQCDKCDQCEDVHTKSSGMTKCENFSPKLTADIKCEIFRRLFWSMANGNNLSFQSGLRFKMLIDGADPRDVMR